MNLCAREHHKERHHEQLLQAMGSLHHADVCENKRVGMLALKAPINGLQHSRGTVSVCYLRLLWRLWIESKLYWCSGWDHQLCPENGLQLSKWGWCTDFLFLPIRYQSTISTGTVLESFCSTLQTKKPMATQPSMNLIYYNCWSNR